MKLERLLALIVLLLNQEKMTSKELADYFEVTQRTIYRDIETINQSGIPVVSFQGRNGGFGIMDTYKIDRNLLTVNDFSMIITALTGIKGTVNDKRLDYLLEKIKNLISARDLEFLNKENEHIIIDFHPWDTCKTGKESFEYIDRAIKEKKIISFSYSNVRGEDTERHVEPVALIVKGYIWYLYGYCLMRNDFRVFRLSRIKSIILLDETFVRRKDPKDFSWNEVWFDRIPKINLLLRFDRKLLVRVEDYFGREYIESQEDGSITVRVEHQHDEWLMGMILSFGSDVEVLEPEYLRQELKETGKKLVEIYDNRDA
jgi:predicted DNA-binding transcriptional regulator YafY